jgi:hypothetical protein
MKVLVTHRLKLQRVDVFTTHQRAQLLRGDRQDLDAARTNALPSTPPA